SMYHKEIRERKEFHYPPFVRLLKIVIKNEDRLICQHVAQHLERILSEKLGKEHVLGPQEPAISKIRNQFLMEIMLKMNKNQAGIQTIKLTVLEESQRLILKKEFKKTRIVLDIDPI